MQNSINGFTFNSSPPATTFRILDKEAIIWAVVSQRFSFFFPFYVDHCLSAVFASFYLWIVSSREVGEGSFWGNFTFLHRSICEQEGLVGTLQMFCMQFLQTYVCEPNPQTTLSNFNSLKPVIKKRQFNAVFTVFQKGFLHVFVCNF